MQDKYFNIQAGGGLQAGDKTRSDKGLFDLVWKEDGSVCFKASNGKSFLDSGSIKTSQRDGLRAIGGINKSLREPERA